MSAWAWCLAGAAALATVYLLRQQLGQLVDRAFGVVYSLLNEIAEGLQGARTWAVTLWRDQFAGPGLAIRPFVGGVLLVGTLVVATVAEFCLLVLTLASVLPAGEEALTFTFWGRSFDPSQLLALGMVSLEFIAGLLAFDLLGVTHFFPFEQVMSPRARKSLSAAFFGLLLLVAALQGALALWRTDQMQRAAEAGQLEGDAGESSSRLNGSNGSSGAGTSEGWVRFIDSLPVPVMGTVGFLIPLLAAVGGIGLYPVLVGALAFLLLVNVLLPLALAAALVGLVRNGVGYAGQVARGILDVLSRPGELVEEWITGRRTAARPDGQNPALPQTGQMTPESTMSNLLPSGTPAGNSSGQSAPDAGTPRPARAPEGTRNGGSTVAEGDLRDVMTALNTNPLGVSDEDLEEISKGPRTNGARARG